MRVELYFSRCWIALAVAVCASDPASYGFGDTEPRGDRTQIQRPKLVGEDMVRVEWLEAQVAELREQGKYADAIRSAEEALAIRRKRQSGWTNVDGNMGEWYEVGDARRAVQDLRRRASLTPEEQFELDEADVAGARAEEHYADRRYQEALAHTQRKLVVYRRLLGDNHSRTLTAINEMGDILHAQGKMAEGEDCYRKTAEGRGSLLGDDHPDTLASFTNLCLSLYAQGKLTEAETYAQKATVGCYHALGDDHPATVSSVNNMALVFHSQGKLDKAEKYYLKAVSAARFVLGEGSPDVGIMQNNLAALYESKGLYDKAESLHREALAIRRKSEAENPTGVINSLNNLAAVLQVKGEYDEAEATYREALAICRSLPGDQGRRPDDILANLGVLLGLKGDYEGAERLHRETLASRRDQFGDESLAVARSLGHVAWLCKTKGNYDEAEQLLREALAMHRKLLGEEHPAVAANLGRLGQLLRAKGDYGQAEELQRKVLEMRRLSLGAEHPDSISAIGDLAALLYVKGMTTEAMELWHQTLEMRRRVLGNDHPHTLDALANLGRLLVFQRKWAEAEPYCRDALNLVERLRTRIIGEERSRAAYAGRLRMSEIAARLSLLLIETDRPSEAWSIAERGRSRALLDLLSRSDRDLIEHARTQVEQSRASKAMDLLETSLDRERHARTDLRTAEELLAGTRRQRRLIQQRIDVDAEEKTTRLAKLDQQIVEQANLVQSKRRTLADAAADMLIRLRDLFPDARPASVRQTRAELDPGEVVLGYIWANDFVLVLALPGATNANVEGLAIARTAQEVQDLAKLVGEFRESIAQRPGASTASTYTEAAGKLLASLLPEKVRQQLGRAKRIIVLPDGPLHGVPFEVLAFSDRPTSNVPSLCNRSIVYASSATVYLNRRAAGHAKLATRGPSSLVLGNPVFERDSRTQPSYPDHGVLLVMVAPDSNAAKAGLVRGDVLLSYDGKAIPNPAALEPAMASVGQAIESGERRAGQRVRVTYWHNGETKWTTLPPGTMGVKASQSNPAEGLSLMARPARGVEQHAAEISATDQVRLFGRTLNTLPGTAREAQVVAELFRKALATSGRSGVRLDPSASVDEKAVVLLLGEDARIANLEAYVSGKRYVHLATHGLTGSKGRPYDASLALTQPTNPTPDDIGFLTLDRLIRNWRGKLSECELVVLSACDTQRGVKAGGSVMALPWGFMYAGAPTVVASLWQVDDVSTSILMEEFYRNLLDPKRRYPVAESLRRAKDALREMKREEAERRLKGMGVADWTGQPRSRADRPEVVLPTDKPFAHPYYWAPFILIGAG